MSPGLVNTHHHLYQTLTRARAQEADLFTWLQTLYPVWAGIDAESEYAAARTGLAELALSGCTTVFDHHYVFPGTSPAGRGAVRAADDVGVKLVFGRGSMDLGASDGGLPPTAWSRTSTRSSSRRRNWRETASTLPWRRALLLGDEGADAGVGGALARASGFRSTRTSRRPSRRRRIAASFMAAARSSTSTSSAGSPRTSGAPTACTSPTTRCSGSPTPGRGRALPDLEPQAGGRVALVRALVDAGARVGLGVDGSASNERSDFFEVKQALLVARGRGGPEAMTVRDSFRLATRGGAEVLRRTDIGSLEPGRRADIAVWRTDGLELGGPSTGRRAGLFRSPPSRSPVRRRRGGVVKDGHLVRADEDEIAREHRVQARRFAA